MRHIIKEENMLQLAAYQDQLYKEPKLRYLFLELTDRCNLNCIHCGSKCTGKNNTFLAYATIERALTSVADKYNPKEIMICITGGEPLLCKNIFRVIHKAHMLGFPVGITSNGTMITDTVAKKLAMAGMDTVAISLDGIGDVHDHFRRSAGSFQKAVEGIKNLKNAGIEPQVMTVVHQNNMKHLDDIYAYLCDLNIYSWRLTNVDPIGRANDRDDLLLTGKQLNKLYSYIRDIRYQSKRMEITYGCSHFLAWDLEHEVRDFYFQCGAGTLVASIMANGNIGACLDIERRKDLVQGNIYKDDFIDVWENRFEIFRRNRALDSQVCGTCKYKNVCHGDSAHTWDYDERKPNYCVIKIMEASDENK